MPRKKAWDGSDRSKPRQKCNVTPDFSYWNVRWTASVFSVRYLWWLIVTKSNSLHYRNVERLMEFPRACHRRSMRGVTEEFWCHRLSHKPLRADVVAYALANMQSTNGSLSVFKCSLRSFVCQPIIFSRFKSRRTCCTSRRLSLSHFAHRDHLTVFTFSGVSEPSVIVSKNEPTAEPTAVRLSVVKFYW